MSPQRALRLATEKTADEDLSLVLSVGGIDRSGAGHADLIAMLPEAALLLLLDGPEGGLGVMVVDPALLASLIEVQTVGQVLPRAVPDRALTRTDAAMAAPLAEGILHRLSQHLADHPDRHWACGYRFGAMIEDRRSVGLALDAADYHVFRLSLDIGQGARQGAILLALPVRPDPAEAAAADAEQAARRLQARVLEAPVRLDAVLCRVSMPLSSIGGLAAGDLLNLPADALREVTIEAGGRRRIATARLGQIDGLRALRLTGAGLRGFEPTHPGPREEGGAPPAPEPAAPEPPAPPEAAPPPDPPPPDPEPMEALPDLSEFALEGEAGFDSLTDSGFDAFSGFAMQGGPEAA